MRTRGRSTGGKRKFSFAVILSARNRPGYNERPPALRLVVHALDSEKTSEAVLVETATDLYPAYESGNSHEKEFGNQVGKLIQRVILLSDATLLVPPIIERKVLVKQIITYVPRGTEIRADAHDLPQCCKSRRVSASRCQG